jgi:hypothetical protein
MMRGTLTPFRLRLRNRADARCGSWSQQTSHHPLRRIAGSARCRTGAGMQRVASPSCASRKWAGDVCLFWAEAPTHFQQASLGSRACCIPAPALRLRTCEGGSGCDDLSAGPRSLFHSNRTVRLRGRCVFVPVGRCAAVSCSGSPGTMKSVKKSMAWKKWRRGNRVHMWPEKRNGPQNRERMKS